MQTLSLQILAAWWATKDHLHHALDRAADDRGELTGSVILLAALAVAAVAVGVVIVARINSHASTIP